MSLVAEVMRIYHGSDGDATRALYVRLESVGPRGVIAVNLLRAQKNSSRAKVYRGGGYRQKAYDRKQWALDKLVQVLLEHGESCGIAFGWGVDEAQPFHRDVLYVELPVGQVSFHCGARGLGPDAPRGFDGCRGASASRVCSFAAAVLAHGIEGEGPGCCNTPSREDSLA